MTSCWIPYLLYLNFWQFKTFPPNQYFCEIFLTIVLFKFNFLVIRHRTHPIRWNFALRCTTAQMCKSFRYITKFLFKFGPAIELFWHSFQIQYKHCTVQYRDFSILVPTSKSSRTEPSFSSPLLCFPSLPYLTEFCFFQKLQKIKNQIIVVVAFCGAV